MKIVVSNNQYRITIPKDLVEEKGWNAGTKLRFVEDIEGNVFLKEISKTKRVNSLQKKSKDSLYTKKSGNSL